MVWRDERPGVQPHPPLQPAIELSGRDQERRGPPVSGRYRELFVSRVGRRPRPQDLESAGSTKVATCAAFAALLPSDFLSPQPRRSNEDVVIPFRLPCSGSIATNLTKYASTVLPQAWFAI